MKLIKTGYEYDFVCAHSLPHRTQPATAPHTQTRIHGDTVYFGEFGLPALTTSYGVRVARRLGRFGFAVLSELPSHSALCTPHSARHCCLTRPQEGKHNPRRACPGQVCLGHTLSPPSIPLHTLAHTCTPDGGRPFVHTPAGWAAAGSCCAPIKDLFERGHAS